MLGKSIERIRDEIEQNADLDRWISDHFKIVSATNLTVHMSVTRNNVPLTEDTKSIRQKAVIYIGKSDSCDVILAHPSTSRRHAVLIVDKTRDTVLVDLNYQNGVEVQGQRILPFIPRVLTPTCTVSFGASQRLY